MQPDRHESLNAADCGQTLAQVATSWPQPVEACPARSKTADAMNHAAARGLIVPRYHAAHARSRPRRAPPHFRWVFGDVRHAARIRLTLGFDPTLG
jgi:hypothetical protein